MSSNVNIAHNRYVQWYLETRVQYKNNSSTTNDLNEIRFTFEKQL